MVAWRLALLLACLLGAATQATPCSSSFFVFPTARVNAAAGPVSYFVYRDPRGASGLTFCRQKGFASLGGVRSSPLASLGKASALNLATEEQCSQPTCHAYLALECVPRGAAPCAADAMGNVGVGHVGADNFGRNCTGNNNIGINQAGNDNVGVGNIGSRNLGISLVGDELRSSPLSTPEGTLVLPDNSSGPFPPIPPQPPCNTAGCPPPHTCPAPAPCPKCAYPPLAPAMRMPPAPPPHPPLPPSTCAPCPLCNYPPSPPSPKPPRPPRPPPPPFPPPSPPQTLECPSICLVPNANQTACVPRMCADPCQDCMEDDVFTWICLDMDPTVLLTFTTEAECQETLKTGECEGSCFKCKHNPNWGCRLATPVYY